MSNKEIINTDEVATPDHQMTPPIYMHSPDCTMPIDAAIGFGLISHGVEKGTATINGVTSTLQNHEYRGVINKEAVAYLESIQEIIQAQPATRTNA